MNRLAAYMTHYQVSTQNSKLLPSPVLCVVHAAIHGFVRQ